MDKSTRNITTDSQQNRGRTLDQQSSSSQEPSYSSACFQRFKPLPSIKDPASQENEYKTDMVGNSCHTKEPAETFADIGIVRNEREAKASLNTIHKYRWREASTSLMTSSDARKHSGQIPQVKNQQIVYSDTARATGNFKHHRSKANLRNSTQLAPDKSPCFVLRNTRCVRQLPPLEPKCSVPPRPACPSPASPPCTPTSFIADD